jgi:carbamate kinase
MALYEGVDAVIDKAFASSLLALELNRISRDFNRCRKGFTYYGKENQGT